jgi:energy-coupling factor transport system permease protein
MRLDPVTKTSFTLFCVVCALTLGWQFNLSLFALLALLALTLPSARNGGVQARSALRVLVSLVAFIVLVSFLNALFIHEGKPLDGPFGITLYEGGLEFGLNTAARLCVLSSSFMLLFLATPLREFIEFLQQLGFPSSLVSILFLTLHFLGQIPQRIHQIFLAQEARGAPVRATFLRRTQSLFLILSPLILSSIVETIERGAALEVRGFRGELRQRDHKAFTASSLTIAAVFLTASLFIILWKLFR